MKPAREPKEEKTLTRRQVLQRLSRRNVGLAASTGIGYAALWEPYHPSVSRVSVVIDGLPPAFDGFRIAHMADLHVQTGFPASRLGAAIALVEQEKPDLVALTGDFVYRAAGDGEPDAHMEACANACKPLASAARYGAWATFGNHDYPPMPGLPKRDVWHDAQIQTLDGESAPLRKNGQTLYLVGLPSFLVRPVSPRHVLETVPEDGPRIVLWHEPDRADECAALGASLQLSGHTHGGQIRVPFIGAPFLPRGGRRYPMGLYDIARGNGKTMPLYVTRGVGVLPPFTRFCCPPEVAIITLLARR